MVVEIDHYAVLGLPSDAGLSHEEIKKAYRSKLLLVHRHPADFLKLVNSYQVLKDPKSRKLFDDHLRIQRERRRRMMRRSKASSSSFVKEEDIIDVDVESISKINVESISKITSATQTQLPFFATDSRRAANDNDWLGTQTQTQLPLHLPSKKDGNGNGNDYDWLGTHVATQQLPLPLPLPLACKKKQDAIAIGNDYDWVLRDICRVLLPNWKGKGEYYTAERLYEIFGHFGRVENVFIYKGGGGALVVMASRDAAFAVTGYISGGDHWNVRVLGDHSNPIYVKCIPEYHRDPMFHVVFKEFVLRSIALHQQQNN